MTEGIPAEEVAELLVELIRNACVNDGTPDSGKEARSVHTLVDYLGEQGRVFEPRPGRQSVLYRVPGRREGAPRIMLMTHLDVVPADPEGWSRDPFGGERMDGMVWGRGAVDMLNLGAAMAAVFRRFLSGELAPLPGDLLLLGVADEEAGGGLGAAWLVEEHWEEVACEYLLTEIAHPALAGPRGPVQPVTVGEKGPSWRAVTASGTPGHGSQPYRTENAVARLARVAAELGSLPTPVLVTDIWRGFAAASGLAQQGLADADRLEEGLAALADEQPALARWAHACTHMTVSPNVLRGGVKANVIPARAELELDIRILPGQETADVDRHLDRVLGGDPRLRMETVLESAATVSPAEGPLWEAIEAALGTEGGGRPVPCLVPVSTDARFFRPRGTVAYGVGSYDDRLDFPTFLSLFHGDDERVSEASLGSTADFLLGMLEAFRERVP